MGYCDPPARAYLHDQGPRDVVPPWDYQRLVFVVDPGREFQLQDLEAVSQPPGAFDVEIVSVYRRWPQYLEEPEEVSMCRDSGDFATFAVDCLLPLSAELEGFEAEVRRSQSHDPARPAVGELRVHHNGLLTAVPLRLGPPEPRIAYADIALPCADEQERRSLLLKVENIGLLPLEVARVRGMAFDIDSARRWSVGAATLDLESPRVWQEVPMAFTVAPGASITHEVTAEGEGPLGMVAFAFVDEAGQSWGSQINPFFWISDWCL